MNIVINKCWWSFATVSLSCPEGALPARPANFLFLWPTFHIRLPLHKGLFTCDVCQNEGMQTPPPPCISQNQKLPYPPLPLEESVNLEIKASLKCEKEM